MHTIPDWYPGSTSEAQDRHAAAGYALAMLHLTPGGAELSISRTPGGPTIATEFGRLYAQGGGCLGQRALFQLWAEFAPTLGLPVVTPEDITVTKEVGA